MNCLIASGDSVIVDGFLSDGLFNTSRRFLTLRLADARTECKKLCDSRAAIFSVELRFYEILLARAVRNSKYTIGKFSTLALFQIFREVA